MMIMTEEEFEAATLRRKDLQSRFQPTCKRCKDGLYMTIHVVVEGSAPSWAGALGATNRTISVSQGDLEEAVVRGLPIKWEHRECALLASAPTDPSGSDDEKVQRVAAFFSWFEDHCYRCGERHTIPDESPGWAKIRPAEVAFGMLSSVLDRSAGIRTKWRHVECPSTPILDGTPAAADQPLAPTAPESKE